MSLQSQNAPLQLGILIHYHRARQTFVYVQVSKFRRIEHFLRT